VTDAERSVAICKLYALRVEGRTAADCARELGVDVQTVYRWMHDPTFADLSFAAESATFEQTIEVRRRLLNHVTSVLDAMDTMTVQQKIEILPRFARFGGWSQR